MPCGCAGRLQGSRRLLRRFFQCICRLPGAPHPSTFAVPGSVRGRFRIAAQDVVATGDYWHSGVLPGAATYATSLLELFHYTTKCHGFASSKNYILCTSGTWDSAHHKLVRIEITWNRKAVTQLALFLPQYSTTTSLNPIATFKSFWCLNR